MSFRYNSYMNHRQHLLDRIADARRRHSSTADGRRAVTRSEAIDIVQRALATGATASDIQTAFAEAGDNGFGAPMERYLHDFAIVRLIGHRVPSPTGSQTLPKAPKLMVGTMSFTSSYGQLTIVPMSPKHGDTPATTTDAPLSVVSLVRMTAESSNPYPYSSGLAEPLSIFGRDGLFDQTMLRIYGYETDDPLSERDRDHATLLMRDSHLAHARQRFIEAKPGQVIVDLPRHPNWQF